MKNSVSVNEMSDLSDEELCKATGGFNPASYRAFLAKAQAERQAEVDAQEPIKGPPPRRQAPILD